MTEETIVPDKKKRAPANKEKAAAASKRYYQKRKATGTLPAKTSYDEYYKEYYKKNKDKVYGYHKKWRKKVAAQKILSGETLIKLPMGKIKAAVSSKTYYQDNRERRLKYHSDRMANDPDFRAKKLQYYKDYRIKKKQLKLQTEQA